MKMIILSIITALIFSCSQPQQDVAKVKQLTPNEFKKQKLSSKSVLLDVRTPEEFSAGHLDGAENVDYRGGDFAKQMSNWDKDKVYYLYCASGNRSGKAAELLREAGFKHIYNIGGYNTLKEAGVPTEVKVKE
ncbi:rhodanese-like domain-containing protein [Pontibacter cellulosilyticus]|uniref:Rhodanese-like domain-containing protein n=1 Tax=Pontibacter cellulosilyticus TaxID=1720253 RepID=A0A923N6F2_9BACT|nr:rhodanese-like domain-containing protein [Pontibacter cellulosilyticus]MBC5992654.1 rhodanese-like domain-containing protein [Pontibacter cellulosilyticus]